jgi:hypothetical protein
LVVKSPRALRLESGEATGDTAGRVSPIPEFRKCAPVLGAKIKVKKL